MTTATKSLRQLTDEQRKTALDYLSRESCASSDAAARR